LPGVASDRENNGGKSNAIDAIRLLTTPLGRRRELYCETTDIRFGSAERKFALTASFAELNPVQKGRMISAATGASIRGCVFGVKYDETTGRFPIRPQLWAGAQQGNPEPGCHECIRHVYYRSCAMRSGRSRRAIRPESMHS
jgi:putative ATP-dependent endonuclease of OLD family